MSDNTNVTGVDAKTEGQVTQEVTFTSNNEPYEAIINMVMVVGNAKYNFGSVWHYAKFRDNPEWTPEVREMRLDEHHMRSLIVAKARRGEDCSEIRTGIRNVHLNGSTTSNKVKARDIKSI